MNFRFSKSGPPSRFARGLLRNSRYWDYVLHPFWDEMNVGIAQDSVYTFSTTPQTLHPFTSRTPVLGNNATQTSLELATPSSSTLNVHWVETPTSHIFRADVPGLRKEDLAILVEGSNLQISGRRNLEHIPTGVNERIQWETPFVRRLKLPTNALIDQINAILDLGVLTLTIPKSQIPPSIAWFVPIHGSPSQVVIRDWNQGEQSQPNTHGFDNRMVQRGPRIKSRSQDNDPPSPSSTQSVCLEERDNLTTHSNVLPISNPTSKTLNITQEEGRWPNSQVTLNININTSKVSTEGESSSVSITPNLQQDEQQLYGKNTLSQSPSTAPISILKRKSSLPQIEDNQDESVEPLPALSRKSSIHIEDQGDKYIDPSSSFPSSLRRTSSIKLQNQAGGNIASSSSPSNLKRKSSINNEDFGAESLDPQFSPSTWKGNSSLPIEDYGDEEEFDPSSSSPSSSAIQRGSKVENVQRLKGLTIGRRNTNEDANRKTMMLANSENEDVLLSTEIEEEDIPEEPSNSQKSQLKRRSEGSAPKNPLEELEERKTSKFEQRGSTQRRNTRSDVALTALKDLESPQKIGKRESRGVGRQPSMVGNDIEEGNSNLEGFESNERQRFSKRGSISKGIGESSREISPNVEEDVPSMDLGSSINQRRRSSKKGSNFKGESSREISPNVGEGVSSMEGSSINQRQRSSKRGSNSKGTQEPSREISPNVEEGVLTMEGSSINQRQRSSKRGSTSNERRKSSKQTSSDVEGDLPPMEGTSSTERRRSTRKGSNPMERRKSTKEGSPESARQKPAFQKKESFSKREYNEDERNPSQGGGRRASTKRLSQTARRRESGRGDIGSSVSLENGEDSEENEI